MCPYVNSELILKPNVQNIWETGPPSRDVLIKTIEICDEMLLMFQEIWMEEYLLSLREICKDLYETNYLENIKIDDVVLIKDPIKPRPHWQFGGVVELFHGEDNKIRSVKVKKGDGLTHYLLRTTIGSSVWFQGPNCKGKKE